MVLYELEQKHRQWHRQRPSGEMNSMARRILETGDEQCCAFGFNKKICRYRSAIAGRCTALSWIKNYVKQGYRENAIKISNE
jgi:hypothetical protein